MSKNSFKDLDDLNIKERGDGKDLTKKNINANINLFGFIGNIIDLYIPTAGSVIKSFSSQQNDDKQAIKKYKVK